MIARELSVRPRIIPETVRRSYALNVDAHDLSLSDRLRLARDTAGLSQRRLAQRSTVSLSVVYSLEYGHVKGDPSARTIGLLARTLGVSMNWLWFGTQEAPA